jgi:integrase
MSGFAMAAGNSGAGDFDAHLDGSSKSSLPPVTQRARRGARGAWLGLSSAGRALTELRLARWTTRVGCVGAHVLRHSLASRLVRSGASLAEISQVLRYRSLRTSIIAWRISDPGYVMRRSF